jgi:hypothetical protein
MLRALLPPPLPLPPSLPPPPAPSPPSPPRPKGVGRERGRGRGKGEEKGREGGGRRKGKRGFDLFPPSCFLSLFFFSLPPLLTLLDLVLFPPLFPSFIFLFLFYLFFSLNTLVKKTFFLLESVILCTKLQIGFFILPEFTTDQLI